MTVFREYYPLPQPEDVSLREKDDAMGAYLMMFAAIGAGLPLPMINLIASVIYYYIHRNKSRFVRFHSLQSLWSQLPVTLLNGILVIWFVRLIIYSEEFSSTFLGFVYAAILVNIIYFIFSIYAAIQAKQGRFYYFFFFGRLAYHITYQVKNEVDDTEKIVNRPPMY
jgi:uncharacterized Tic20 family protein